MKQLIFFLAALFNSLSLMAQTSDNSVCGEGLARKAQATFPENFLPMEFVLNKPLHEMSVNGFCEMQTTDGSYTAFLWPASKVKTSGAEVFLGVGGDFECGYKYALFLVGDSGYMKGAAKFSHYRSAYIVHYIDPSCDCAKSALLNFRAGTVIVDGKLFQE